MNEQGMGASAEADRAATPSGLSRASASSCQHGIPSAGLPVLTMWQPWASLLMSRRKLYETRSFRPPSKYIGQRIGIHSAAALPSSKHFSEELLELCYDEFGCSWNYSLPRGSILGTVRIGSVVSTNDLFCSSIFEAHPDERCAGDWSSNRFGWWTWDVEIFPSPIPAKGKQGWWRFPASAIEARSDATAKTGAAEGESAVRDSADAHPSSEDQQ